ncbi:hypothetical protein [Paenibacillus naphthalenovorans]|uniref:hypothetical protein n=1 Tax=Paenibacillus naphthalenovorans TaxID=162209 RepID=UPI0011A994F8|nr:hypothetical protein [Paenibacillus naphthalenovorans]
MKAKERARAIGEALLAVASDTVVSRDDEKLFGILFANHLQMNGYKKDIDPDLLILSMRDAYHELQHHKKHNPEATIETVFTKQYIDKLIEKGWYTRPEDKVLEW